MPAINNTLNPGLNGLLKPPSSSPLFSTNYNLGSQYANAQSQNQGLSISGNVNNMGVQPGAGISNATGTNSGGLIPTANAQTVNTQATQVPAQTQNQTQNTQTQNTLPPNQNNTQNFGANFNPYTFNPVQYGLTATTNAQGGTAYMDVQGNTWSAGPNGLQMTQQANNGQYNQPNVNGVPTNPSAANGVTFPSTVSALAGMGAQPTAQYTAAQQQYLQANQALQGLNTQAANQTANIMGSRTNLAEAGGESGILQNLTANERAALTGEMTAAQSAAQAATAQQGTQQQGLQAAGGLVAPTPANAFGFFNPATGLVTPYQNAAGGGTNQSGVGAASTVAGNYQGGVNFQTNMVPSYQSAVNDANQFVQWLQTPASQGGGEGVNPVQFNAGNALINWASGQNYSNPQYPQLATYLNDFSSKLSSILGGNSGEITNYKQQLVNSMLNGTADVGSIQQQMQTMLNVATATMQGYASTFGINWNPGQGMQGGTQTNGPTTNTNNPYNW